MTTSITDARFTHLHATPGYISALLTDTAPEEDPDPWSVMPGYDENLPIPLHLDPPRPDHDGPLPSQIHPSYPFGRPRRHNGGKKNRKPAPGSFLGHDGGSDMWTDMNLGALIESAEDREEPPVMAGSKRPPSPPSPKLRPSRSLEPRSQHLRRYLERQQETTAPVSGDQFDAPVPNETYAEDEESQQQQGQVQRTPQ